ncbi:MAG: PD40 domain-containing protein [Anaerolineales bacterium]|nr:PD40 domain-containing protein [Anaerolineales bacterium]
MRPFVLFTVILVLSAATALAASSPRPPDDPLRRARLPYLAPAPDTVDPLHDPLLPQARLPWSRLVYQSLRDGNWEIYHSYDDGTGAVRLTNDGRADIHPRLNRGGTRIASAASGGGDYDLFVMNADGSGATPLTTNDTDDVAPTWSPDGSQLAFQAYRDGQPEIYRMNADGTGAVRLTQNAAYDGYPGWSPDGSKLVFTSNRTGGYRIHVMNVDGSAVTRLSSQPGSTYPAWSPDGRQIAYSADGDGDGWLEAWVMNADGTGQHVIYDPSGTRDAWVSGWSPNGKYVTLTDITFVYFSGSWYWTTAYGRAVNAGDPLEVIALSSDNTLWNPDWQTLDTAKPVSSIAPLPAQSPYPIPVSWSGSDSGGSGVMSYDVQVMVNNSGTWQDWLVGVTQTSAGYAGSPGTTYAFRARARDHSQNVEAWPNSAEAVTTIEALAPQTAVSPLPAFSRADDSLTVRWGGFDPGGTGIQSYDVQYRIGSGSWQNWLMGIDATGGELRPSGAAAGDTVYFRSRAADYAGNQEPWPPDNGDTGTTLYTWGIGGVGYDNAGTPISGVAAFITQGTFASQADTPDGQYAAYSILNGNPYAVAWSRAGMGSLPATPYAAGADARQNVYLPPADDIWTNGNFESGNGRLSAAAPIVTNTLAHTGDYALLLGAVDGFFAPPQQLSNTPEFAEYPEAAFDDAGNLHVVWQEGMGVDADIFYTYRSPAGVWSAPVNISPDPTSRYHEPRLLVRGDVVHVTFRGFTGTSPFNDDLYYTYRASNGTWSTPYRVNGSIDSGAYQFTVSANGDAHFLWRHNDYWILYYTRRASSGVWDPPYELTPSPNGDGPVDWPNLVADANSNVYLVWNYHSVYSGGWARIEFASRSAAGTWTRYAPVVSSSADEFSLLKLLIDDDNRLHLLWHDEIPPAGAPDENILYYATYSNGGWSSPLRLGAPLVAFEGSVELESDAAGELHLLFQDVSSAGASSIVYRKRLANGAWQPATTLYSPAGAFVNVSEPALAVANGHVYAAWNATNGDLSQIMLTQKSGSESWRAPVLLAPTLAESRRARLRLDANGRLHVIWHDGHVGYSDADTKVYYTTETLAAAADEVLYSQAVTLPVTMTRAVVSYLYRLTNASPTNGMGLFVDVTDTGGTTTLAVHTADRPDWTHSWADVGAWAGQQVTVTFRLHQAAGQPLVQANLDDVSLGSAPADAWLAVANNAAAPGETAVFTLRYGNRGAAVAANTRLTMTLPAEIQFSGASIPPLTTHPLVWDLGALPGHSGPYTLVVSGTVSAAAPLWQTAVTPVAITADAELEFLNNVADVQTYFGRLLYLPVVMRR